jgi:hypothetical protein
MVAATAVEEAVVFTAEAVVVVFMAVLLADITVVAATTVAPAPMVMVPMVAAVPTEAAPTGVCAEVQPHAAAPVHLTAGTQTATPLLAILRPASIPLVQAAQGRPAEARLPDQVQVPDLARPQARDPKVRDLKAQDQQSHRTRLMMASFIPSAELTPHQL